MTNLVQTITDRDQYIIYYDNDVFNNDVTLSIHVTMPNVTNNSGIVQFSQTDSIEWNTIYDEQFGTNGAIDGQTSMSFVVELTPGINSISYQDYDFALLTYANFVSYGTSGNSGTQGNAVINVISDTVDIYNPNSYNDTGILSLSGQILNYYQTVNNVPQYVVQKLSEIAVQIWALPNKVTIDGPNTVPQHSTKTFSIDLNYDPSNNFSYYWRLKKITNVDTDSSNNRATIVTSNIGVKTIDINFVKGGFVTLELIITGPTGCPRIIRKQINVELQLTKMLVIRNRLI